ncbi:MAG: DUF4395 domain-containing protein [Chloroflexota bacterium]
MSEQLQAIDHSAIKVSQVTVVGLNILAFVFNAPVLATLVAGVMLLGALFGFPGFGFIYRWVLKPLGLAKPYVLMDHREPHRFAQGLGGLFMAGGSLALFAGLPPLGWSLVWLVAALAALNAFAGFCVGCMLYYWLARFKVPGFRKSPPQDTFPGMRPKTRVYES